MHASRGATSRGRPRRRRSGATASSPTRTTRRVLLDRRIPVDRPARRGTRSRACSNQSLDLRFEIAAPSEELARRNPTAARAQELEASVAQQPRAAHEGRGRLRKDREAQAASCEAKAQAADKAGKPTEADALRAAGRRAALAADPDRDDLQRLPDHQGARRRAGLRRDRRSTNPRTGIAAVSATSSRSASTTPTSRSIPPAYPGRLARRPEDRGPLHQPDPVPRHGRERPLHPGRVRATSA